MVAGTDAFAGSLHAQFDLVLIVVAPTRRSVEVYGQYLKLAESSGIADRIAVLGNQVENQGDRDFMVDNIMSEHLVGFFERDSYIDCMDRHSDLAMDAVRLSPANLLVLESTLDTLMKYARHPDSRLPYLHELHQKYVAQAFVVRQFGDLTTQIDPNFHYPC